MSTTLHKAASFPVSHMAEHLIGSEIIKLGNEVNERIRAGEQITNFTIGDFDPAVFPIPNLLLEEIGCIDADDPRYVSTVLKTREQLGKNGFVFRYLNEDDFGVPRSAFLLCTFWMVSSLIKIGRREEAVDVFNNAISCANHVGLLSEHIDVETRELLGNFPQAYSHLGLIQAALLINGEELSFENDIFKYVKP